MPNPALTSLLNQWYLTWDTVWKYTRRERGGISHNFWSITFTLHLAYVYKCRLLRTEIQTYDMHINFPNVTWYAFFSPDPCIRELHVSPAKASTVTFAHTFHSWAQSNAWNEHPIEHIKLYILPNEWHYRIDNICVKGFVSKHKGVELNTCYRAMRLLLTWL